jgi:hypothetical protein
VNAIESRRIPLTNNATELVNRRFDQHYQNFCGFQTIETAQRYLAIFERTYGCGRSPNWVTLSAGGGLPARGCGILWAR